MLCVLVLGVALASCNSPNRGGATQPSAASGLILDLVASPNVVRGQTAGTDVTGGGCSNVQAKVSDTSGSLIDGAEVRFTTSLCCFVVGADSNIVSATVTTTRGVANITFCPRKERGTATITASVEDAFDTVLITVF
jgi:hypothetical protein